MLLQLVLYLCGTYIFSIIALIYVDIAYNNAFGDIFRILWFILAIILHMIIMIFWTLATSIIGYIIVFSIGSLTRLLKKSIIYQFKLKGKIKRIKNSEYINKLFNEIDGKEIRNIVIKSNNLTIIDTNKNEKDLSFIDDGYSSLDKYGRLALATLIAKKYKYLKIKEDFKSVDVFNKALMKQEEKEEKIKKANKIQEEKKQKKDDLKNGKTW